MWHSSALIWNVGVFTARLRAYARYLSLNVGNPRTLPPTLCLSRALHFGILDVLRAAIASVCRGIWMESLEDNTVESPHCVQDTLGFNLSKQDFYFVLLLPKELGGFSAVSQLICGASVLPGWWSLLHLSFWLLVLASITSCVHNGLLLGQLRFGFGRGVLAPGCRSDPPQWLYRQHPIAVCAEGELRDRHVQVETLEIRAGLALRCSFSLSISLCC